MLIIVPPFGVVVPRAELCSLDGVDEQIVHSPEGGRGVRYHDLASITVRRQSTSRSGRSTVTVREGCRTSPDGSIPGTGSRNRMHTPARVAVPKGQAAVGGRHPRADRLPRRVGPGDLRRHDVGQRRGHVPAAEANVEDVIVHPHPARALVDTEQPQDRLGHHPGVTAGEVEVHGEGRRRLV